MSKDLNIPVSEIMTKKLITVTPKDNLKLAYSIFKQHRFHHLPVVRYKELVGIFSKADMLLITHGSNNPGSPTKENEEIYNNTLIEDVMITKMATLAPDQSIRVAAEIFKENLFHSVPVVENGELVGLVTTHDLLKYAFS